MLCAELHMCPGCCPEQCALVAGWVLSSSLNKAAGSRGSAAVIWCIQARGSVLPVLVAPPECRNCCLPPNFLKNPPQSLASSIHPIHPHRCALMLLSVDAGRRSCWKQPGSGTPALQTFPPSPPTALQPPTALSWPLCPACPSGQRSQPCLSGPGERICLPCPRSRGARICPSCPASRRCLPCPRCLGSPDLGICPSCQICQRCL